VLRWRFANLIHDSRTLMRPSRGLPLRFQTALVVMFFVAVLSAASAQNSTPPPQQWNDAMSQLADKIAAAVRPPHSLALDVIENNSSISPADAAALSRLLETELATRKIRVTQEDSPETIVYVKISEGVEGPSMTAEIRRRDDEDSKGQIAIVALQKRATTSSGDVGVSLILQRKFVFAQAEPILDFMGPDASDGPSPRLMVLDRDRVAYLRLDQRQWSLDSSVPVRSRFPPSRDPRGLIAKDDDGIRVHLPHDYCVGAGRTDVKCRPNVRTKPAVDVALGQSWPLMGGGPQKPSAGYASYRNYFDGPITFFGDVMTVLPAFYSSALMNDQKNAPWILAELDGKARLYDGLASATAIFSGWGDNLVSVAADCDSAWLVLVTGAGDWMARDTLQIYRVADHQAATVGQPLEFSGPILALWPAEDGKSVRVVSRNLQTGLYEASIVSVSCGN
jgi:hypothetical protein